MSNESNLENKVIRLEQYITDLEAGHKAVYDREKKLLKANERLRLELNMTVTRCMRYERQIGKLNAQDH